jgi:ubiquinone/menaquinone biosynthesis C-methylase UbiE
VPFYIESEYQPFPNMDGRDSRQARIEVPLFATLLRIPRCARILEVGCGRGVALGSLADRRSPRHLVGLDLDRESLAEARRNDVPGALVQSDVRSIPFRDESFDVVIDFGTCYHIARSELALAEIARVLRVGGIFCTETKLSQLLSHPVRSFRRALRWKRVKAFELQSHALLWMKLRKSEGTVADARAGAGAR